MIGQRLLLPIALVLTCSCGQERAEAPSAPQVPAGIVPGKPNILLVTVDTLRADHLGCYGYFRNTSPVIDALADEALRFEHCLAPVATTLPSHTSMLTGTAPLEHGVLANIQDGMLFRRSPGLKTLAEFFQSQGYDTAAVVSAFPLSARFGLQDGFDYYSYTGQKTRDAEDTTDLALAWLARERERPFFLWVHYFDPHSIFAPPPPFNTAFGSESPDGQLERWISERRITDTAVGPTGRELEAVSGINAYDGEIAYMDTQLGVLFDQLRSDGLWEEIIVAFLSDHGEGLNQHGLPGHGWVWEEHLRIPFLLRVPGVAARVVPGIVGAVDLIPTLFHLLDLPGRSQFLEQCSGRNFFRAPLGEPVLGQSSPRQTDYQEFLTFTVSTPRWKFHSGPEGHEQLYDLEADPHELNDLSQSEPEVMAELRDWMTEKVARQMERHEELGTAPSSSASQPEVEALEALGYGGSQDK